jgi:hypothetical protein
VKNSLLLALTALSVSLLPMAPAQGRKMDAKLRYTSTVADDRHSTQFDVSPQGVGRLAVGSNRDQRARAIGHFEAPLPPAVAEPLAAALADPALAASPTQSALAPDEAYRRVQVTRGSAAAVDKVVGEQLPMPAAFARADAAIQAAIASVARSPVQALAMRLTASAPSLRRGAAQELELQLANVGRVPLQIAAPPRWGQQATAATLGALRSDVAQSALGAEHQKFEPLGAANFVSAEPAMAGHVLLLPPGGRSKLRFRVPIDWPPGRYRIEIDFEVTALSDSGQALFNGALFSEQVDVEVLPR